MTSFIKYHLLREAGRQDCLSFKQKCEMAKVLIHHMQSTPSMPLYSSYQPFSCHRDVLSTWLFGQLEPSNLKLFIVEMFSKTFHSMICLTIRPVIGRLWKRPYGTRQYNKDSLLGPEEKGEQFLTFSTQPLNSALVFLSWQLRQEMLMLIHVVWGEKKLS